MLSAYFLADRKGFEVFMSPTCLAIVFYFAEKKYNSAWAKEKINLLCDHICITEASKTALQKPLKNPAVLDFEEGMEYYAAVEHKCTCIMTEDIGDFPFADIQAMRSEDFLKSLR